MLVGDASVVAKQLAGVGFDEVERISIADLDLSSPDLRRHAAPGGRADRAGRVPRAAAAVPAATGCRGRRGRRRAALIARAVAAKGGLEVLRSIRTSRVQRHHRRGRERRARPNFRARRYIRYPGAFRSEAQLPGGRLVQVFNAGTAWFAGRGGHARRPAGDGRPDARAPCSAICVPLLLALADGKLPAHRVADVVEADRSCRRSRSHCRMHRPLTLLFDPDDHACS